jgi:hypothetical protein
MLSIPPGVKLWFAGGVDLRLGFDGLAALVRTQLNADPLSGHLFVFTNRSANRLKVLYWGGHGLCLWCSRLEAGCYLVIGMRKGFSRNGIKRGWKCSSGNRFRPRRISR